MTDARDHERRLVRELASLRKARRAPARAARAVSENDPATKLNGEPGEATPRQRLTRGERVALMHRQGGFCGCGCTRALFNENDPSVWWPMIDEHILPLELGGSNDLSNRALYLAECAKKKTKDDIRRIAKAKRQAKLLKPREPSKRPLKSRGFR